MSTFIGLWFGCVTLALTSHRARLKAWACASILLFELGVALHVSGTIPLNKNLCARASLLTLSLAKHCCGVRFTGLCNIFSARQSENQALFS